MEIYENYTNTVDNIHQSIGNEINTDDQSDILKRSSESLLIHWKKN